VGEVDLVAAGDARHRAQERLEVLGPAREIPVLDDGAQIRPVVDLEAHHEGAVAQAHGDGAAPLAGIADLLEEGGEIGEKGPAATLVEQPLEELHRRRGEAGGLEALLQKFGAHDAGKVVERVGPLEAELGIEARAHRSGEGDHQIGGRIGDHPVAADLPGRAQGIELTGGEAGREEPVRHLLRRLIDEDPVGVAEHPGVGQEGVRRLDGDPRVLELPPAPGLSDRGAPGADGAGRGTRRGAGGHGRARRRGPPAPRPRQLDAPPGRQDRPQRHHPRPVRRTRLYGGGGGLVVAAAAAALAAWC
jgi:hypothetical protein